MPLPVLVVFIGVAGLLVSGCNRQETRMDGIKAGHSPQPDVHQVSAVTVNAPSKFLPVAGRPAPRLSDGSLAVGKEAASHEAEPSLPSAPGDQAGSQAEALPIPLAAVGFNPALKLNPQQVAQVVRLGQDFLAATDATSAAPGPTLPTATTATSPATANHTRWITAQSESDMLFRAMFGYAAYNAQQLMRAQQAYRDQSAAGK